MLLFIDAANSENIRLALVSSAFISEHHFNNSNLSEKLLIEIKKFLKKEKIDFSDLHKIAVISGPGPFSKIRTAVAISNALAFGLKISVVSIKAGQPLVWDEVLAKKGRAQVLPFYDKAPSITLSKKKL